MDSETTSGGNLPCWMDDGAPINYPQLSEDVTCDVCVIGGGIAGLSTAYRLAGEGLDVLLIDDGKLGSGETGRTSAHLASAVDDRYHDIERLHGADAARIVHDSHAAAIDWIEHVADEEDIACAFRRVDGWLFMAADEPIDLLADELLAARRAGLAGTTLVARIPGLPFDSGRALRFPDQAEFHPLAFLRGLAAAAVRKGVRLHARTHASEVHGGDHPTVLTENGAMIHADHVVVATNVPVNDRVLLHTKLEPYRTYVIAAAIPRGSVPHGLYWDTLDPYHYVRVAERGGDDLLIVGGEDHKVGHAEDQATRYLLLERWMRDRFPSAGDIVHRWSGQIIEPVDGLAYIGRNPHEDHVFVVTGDSGNGLTHGVIGALVIGDLILGRDNPWAALYDPSRKRVKAAIEYAKHNADVAAQYRDWLTPGEKHEDDLAPGEGMVVRHGMGKVAISCDASGVRRACSATCPHLKGVVRWNADEGTWDCPAHGSRFDPHGHVINGPANSDLTPVPMPEPIRR